MKWVRRVSSDGCLSETKRRRGASSGGYILFSIGDVLQAEEDVLHTSTTRHTQKNVTRQETPLLHDICRYRTCTRRRIIMVAHDSVGSTPCARMSANCSSASSSIPSDASSCTSRLHIGHGGYAPRLRMRLKYSSASCLHRNQAEASPSQSQC